MHQLALEQRGRLSFNSEQYSFLKIKQISTYIFYIYGSHFLKCKYLESNIKFLLYKYNYSEIILLFNVLMFSRTLVP